MADYKIEIKRSAAEELEKIQKKDRDRIIEKIQALSEDPRPPQSKKLSGEEKYRIRHGDYRVLYQIYDEVITVVVVRVAHRKEAYKR
ncbi:type II toxin-antitoxin system RelE/ParE family toxin [Pelagicoccus sp. NFK12]|uniref:Type II toxin-antitoxin system RelE/ParE family toxin n=1 Tax=Pelagicoccus enzymogenes TaxID=2773457 RepID=A0A927F4E6_9BACT|nr:type II toxin-antitoxin system RelE/ParE family toxin [Pelagicoccus enzymogenes]MBD5778232.1 type II toxin-antitoxin system RelE/ParE family toxin [Pelagicoccus enzymogenes]